DKPFIWTDVEPAAFEALRTALITASVLAQPNFSQPFRLYTDASNVGIGAILGQVQNDDTERVICYISRQLNAAEQNYSATELECLAIVWSLNKLHTYLDGSKFECITDHSALRWLFDFNGHNKRLLSWSLSIQNYRDT
ncbi:unnamed protein product, partial [Didymodactylos carnosus]